MNKQDLENKITELEKQLTQLKKELKKPINSVFKPKIGDEYYVINGNGEIVQYHWNDDRIDNMYYAMGNCFKTEEEAEFESERLKVIAELERFAEGHNEPIDWNNRDQYKYYIAFSTEIQHIDYYCTFTVKLNNIYFSSKELARQAVAEIGEARIVKYYFMVE